MDRSTTKLPDDAAHAIVRQLLPRLTRRIPSVGCPNGPETALVTLLAPVLPALIGAGQRIGQDAANAVGAEAADLARRVWDRLQKSLADRPTAKSAAGDVAADPNDETARQTLNFN